MDMKFSASVIKAIDGLMRLQQGEFRSSPVPDWSNFRFPTKIKAGRISRNKRDGLPLSGQTETWDISRKFEFFYQRTRIASVFLDGSEVHWDKESSHNQTFWGVRRIEYLPDLMEGTVEEAVDVMDRPVMASR